MQPPTLQIQKLALGEYQLDPGFPPKLRPQLLRCAGDRPDFFGRAHLQVNPTQHSKKTQHRNGMNSCQNERPLEKNNLCKKTYIRVRLCGITWVVALSSSTVAVTRNLIVSLVGDLNINLHLPLLLARGTIQSIT